MIPIVREVFNRASEASDDLLRQAQCLTEPFWDVLFNKGYLREIESSEVGLLLHPLAGPQSIAQFFDGFCDAKFTRQRDESGLYQWVTTYAEYNIQLWIIANENIDLTGTEITFNPLK